MGGTSPSPFSNAFDAIAVNSLRYNTSQYGSVVPVLWGTHRLTVNLIDQFGFSSHGGGKGGKGGGGGGSSGGKKGGSQYSVNVAFALCEGPGSFTGASNGVGGLNLVWSNGGVTAGLSKPGLNGYAGTAGQAADPVFSSSDPNQPVPGYSNTCYVTGTPMYLGGTPSLPSIQFQIGGQQRGTAGTSFPDDARPDAVISDLLTNASYGAGFPAGNLADLSGAGNFCQAQGLAVSLLCDRQDTAARWLKEVMDACVLGAFFSGSELKIVPFVSTALSAYGASFTPALSPAYSLSDSDFLDWESAKGSASNARAGGKKDPIEVTRKDPAQEPNWLSIEYMPAQYWYNRAVVFADDQDAIAAYGLRLKPSLQGNFFTNATSAQAAAWLQLQRGLYNLNQYRFRLNISKCLLEPMDILELTESISGLSSWPVRVIAVEEDEESTIIVTAEDMFEYSGAGVVPPGAAAAAGTGLQVNPTASPGSTNPPVVFEPSYYLTNGDNEVWIVASGGPNWGGCDIWVSFDGTSYGQLGTIFRGGRQGVLTAAFPSASDPDTADTLAVDLSESEGTLDSGTKAEADAFVTLCWVDGELVSYETATATSPQYHYNIGTYIRRGVYGTTIGSHASGSQFARIDSTVFKLNFASNLIPQTFYLKLPAFNLFGQEKEDLSTVTAYTYTTTGSGTAAGNLYISGSESGKPAAGATLQLYTFPERATSAVNFAGSVGSAGTAPTAAASFSIDKNGVAIGSMNFAAGAKSATFTLTSATTFAAGDVLTLLAPSPQDSTLANVSWTLLATT